MNRRELLAALGGAGAALAALPPERLWAATRHLQHQPGRSLGPFSPHEAETVARMAELIIPRTDTPGAIEARVPEFIATIAGEWYAAEDKALFLAGLAEVDTRSRREGNKDFVGLTAEQQTAILAALDAELQASRERKEPTEDNFFRRFKGLTLYGYYTSEPGMKLELQYAVIPGRYDPCTPMRPR